MKLLIIEDDPTAVKGIKDNFEDIGWSVLNSDFERALENIRKEQPDIIVMDWMEDLDDNKDRGRAIFNETHNLPIIIYSGIASALEVDEIENNPFIEKIPKGDEQDVISKIKEWEKYIKVVSEIKNQFDASVPSKISTWTKIKNFLFQDITVELTPRQEATFKAINDFWHQEIDETQAKSFLFQKIQF